MIKLKTQEELSILREGGKRLAFILEETKKMVAPGVATKELDKFAYELIVAGGDRPAFLNYQPQDSKYPYPASLCVSINDEIVHGLPSLRQLRDGDIVSLDLGLEHGGLFTDMAVTVPVGKVSVEVENLIKTANEALMAGISIIRPGGRIGDISAMIELTIKKNNFQVVKELAGHGVGYKVHEDPFVPNYGRKGSGPELLPGLVLAIEPMATTGKGKIKMATSDKFTFCTQDGHLASHAEKTVAVTENGAEILTIL